MKSIAAFLRNLFTPRGITTPAPDNPYPGVRRQILHMRPPLSGDMPADDPRHVWGLVMEVGFPGVVMTVVALHDGTANLYYSNGTGFIRAGGQAGPADIARRVVDAATTWVEMSEPTTEYPLPREGHVIFYFLTLSGVMTTGTRETELEFNEHPLAELYHLAQGLIVQMRHYEQHRP